MYIYIYMYAYISEVLFGQLMGKRSEEIWDISCLDGRTDVTSLGRSSLLQFQLMQWIYTWIRQTNNYRFL